MDNEAPVLIGRNLHRSFGDGENRTKILHGISLELNRGELAVIMGPSGSGKTTLLAILSGLLQPDEGEVRVHDESLWKMSDRRRERFRLHHCGFIFQGHNLFPALTARQQLEIVLRWGEGRSGREMRDEVDRMLGMLGLAEKKRGLRPIELSGGEKQRVSIGRALIKKPSLVFADEPTAALDWHNGERVIELLQQAGRDYQAAILVVTHDERIKKYADRVYHLDDGRLADEIHPQYSPPAYSLDSFHE